MRPRQFIPAALVGLSFLVLCVVGQSQTLNPSSISTNGSVNVIVQDSANIYIGGSFSGAGRKARGIAKIDTTALAALDFPSLNGTAYTVISDSAGGWYVGGDFTVSGLSRLVHVLPDNTIDASFAPNPTSYIYALYLEDNTLYVGGSFTQISGQNQNGLAAVDATTGVLQSWNPNPLCTGCGSPTINSITKDGNKVYVGGRFSEIGGRKCFNFATIDAVTGNSIPSISTQSTSNQYQVQVIEQDESNVYVGGSFGDVSGYYVGRGALLGTESDLPDFSFPVIDGNINKSIPDGTGGWYVGGDFTVSGLSRLVHVLPDNTIDASFAPNPNSYIYALYLEDNTLYVGGSFTQISGQNQNGLAAVDATTGVLQSWNPNPLCTGCGSPTINSITKDGNKVYVGGRFSEIGGRKCFNFATIDAVTGNSIPSISTQSTSNQYQVQVIEQDESNVYVGGSFGDVSGYYVGRGALLGTESDLPDFSFPVIDGNINKSIPDGTGGWYVGGDFTVSGLSRLVHVLPDNTIDASFAPNPNSYIYALYLEDNTLYVGGSFTQISGQNQNGLAAVDATTGVLQSWNPNPLCTGCGSPTINSITKDGNKVYVGGRFSEIGGRKCFNFATIDAVTGNSIPSISTQSTSNQYQVQVIEQDESNVYVGGSFGDVSGYYVGRGALLGTESDLPDFSFPVIDGNINKSIPDGTGGWYVGGDFTVSGLSRLVHVLPDNTIDASFAPNPNSYIYALYLEDNTLYVGGSFTQISGQNQNRLAAINATTGVLQSWNPDANNTVQTITKNDNTIYVGGDFTTVGGQTRNRIAAIDVLTGDVTSWNPNANNSVQILEINGAEIIAGGSFTNIGGNNRSYLAALSLATGLITSWNPNPSNQVKAIELNGANAYVGGGFNTIGGQPRNHIAEISLSTGNATTWNPNASSWVYAIKKIGTTVYAGGAFATIGGQTRNRLAALNNTNGNALEWDPSPNSDVNTLAVNGTSIFSGGSFTHLKAVTRNKLMAISKTTGLITSWNPNPLGTITVIEMNGENAYVGGGFPTIGGQPRNNIAEISLSTGNATTWNPNASSWVYAIKKIGTTVYAGGAFATIGGQTRNRLAALNNTNGNALEWDPSPNSDVNTLAVNGTSIFSGGSFTHLKAVTRNKLMAISKTTGLITSWNPNPLGTITVIEMNGENAYVGGGFPTIGGQPRNNIAEISLSTGNATTWNPNASTWVRDIKKNGTTVYVGGQFTTIGGQSRKYLAALDASTGNALDWNPSPNTNILTLAINGTSIFAGGSFTHLKSETRNNLMAISKTTGLITSWNPNPLGTITVIEMNGENAYVGGGFPTIGGQPRNNIAEISLSTGNATAWNPNASTWVRDIKKNGTTVYVGGQFTTIGGQSRKYLAALDASTGNALAWNPNPDGTVQKIVQSGTDIIAAGGFTFINSEQRSNLLAISKATGLITSWSPNPNAAVQAIELNGTNAYIGGSFSSVGGQTRNRIAEISLATGNATTWNPDANSTVNAIKKFGNTVYAAGAFTTIGGQMRNRLAALNTTAGSATAWNPDVNSTVRRLGISDSVLYVAGDYTSINGQTRNRRSSFALPDGSITAWNPDVNGSVYDIYITGSNIYACGSFSQVSGQNRSKVACISKASGNLTGWNPSINGSSASSILVKGKRVFAGGGFNTVGGQSCNGFAVINANSGIPDLFFPNVQGGQINTMSAYDSLIYLGGSFTSINGINYGGLASVAYPDAFFKPEIEDFNPKTGGNIGEVTMTIHGNGFEDGTTVKLTKAGQTDIPLQNTYISDGIRITGTFNLTGALIGDWNLVVQIPDDTTMIVPNSFAVQEGIAPNIWTSIVGFEVIRIGQWQSYNLVYGNTGNIDAHGVPVYLVIAGDTTIESKMQFSFDLDSRYSESIQFVDSIPTYIITDTIFNHPRAGIIYPIYLPCIPSQYVGNLSFRIKKNTSGQFEMFSYSSTPFFQSPMNENVKSCIGQVLVDHAADILIDMIPGSDCVKAESQIIAEPLAGFLTGKPTSEMKQSFVWNLTQAIVTCVADFTPQSKIYKLAKGAMKIMNMLNNISEYPECNAGFHQIKNQYFSGNTSNINISENTLGPVISTVNSFDPNDKLGPIGVGSENYINVNGILPYIIRCENADTASASAQTVLIVDTLDQSVFDLSTFQLGFFSIADSIIPIPSGLKHYEADIDLRPANNIIARVKAKLDMQTGVATWEFTSLDPQTLQPTENPFAGFMPPNVNKPEGEAAVMYSIKTWPHIENGTQIKNKAYIYFDYNPPIITNECMNTSDVIKPVSQMNTLAATHYGATVDLSWSGSDVGSGVRSYAIYYSVNEGPFEVLASHIPETTFSFTGEIDSTYSFFSIATDSVGNVENMKTLAEATTLLLVGIKENRFMENINVSVYPNPNDGNFSLSVHSPVAGMFDISVSDVSGRIIHQQAQYFGREKTVVPLSIHQPGVYLLSIGNGNSRTVKRVIINQ